MMWFMFFGAIAFIALYLVIGITMAVRIKTLSDCNKHENMDDTMWLIILMWLPLAYYKVWKDGIEGL